MHVTALTCCFFYHAVLTVVPRVESIGEESPVHERGLELLPVSDNNLAIIDSDIAGALVNLNPPYPEPIISTNHSCAPPDPLLHGPLVHDTLVHESKLNTDLEANIRSSSAGDEGLGGNINENATSFYTTTHPEKSSAESVQAHIDKIV